MMAMNTRSLIRGPLGALFVLGLASCQKDTTPQPTPTGTPPPDLYAQTFSSAQDFTNGTLYGVTATADGRLQMSTGMTQYQTPYLWVPNSMDNPPSVSLIDTSSQKLIGTYLLVSDQGEVCYNPSRTTVDANFDVWIGCRGNSSYCDGPCCNGCLPNVDDKVMKVSHATGQILLTVHVGEAPRALALDANNHLWIGSSDDDTVWELDGATGACIRGNGCPNPAINMPEGPLGFPYGAVIDADGFMWIENKGSIVGGVDKLDQIDTSTGQIVGTYGPYMRTMTDGSSCSQLYGITVDELGDIWLGGFDCNDVVKVHGVHTGTPGTLIGAYQTGGKKTRGVSIDMHGNVWVGDYDTNTASKINGASGQVITSVSVGKGPIGVSADALGHLWAVSYEDGLVTRINGTDYSNMATVKVGTNPYTYSDMLGLILHYITLRNRNMAYWRGTIDAGAEATFTSVNWQADVPQGTQLTVHWRCGDTTAALQAAAFSPEVNAPPAAVDCGGPARYLEVEVRFYASGTTASPVLHDVTAYWKE